MHRIARGIREMTNYLRNNRDALFSQVRSDLFHASLLLQSGVKARGGDDGEVKKLIEKQLGYAKELGIFQEELLVSCAKEYASNTEKETAVDQECKTDLEYILQFAGYEGDKYQEMQELFVAYEKSKMQTIRMRQPIVCASRWEKSFMNCTGTAFYRQWRAGKRSRRSWRCFSILPILIRAF